MVFNEFQRVFMGFIGFYLVLPSFTGFYWVLPGFTEFFFVGCAFLPPTGPPRLGLNEPNGIDSRSVGEHRPRGHAERRENENAVTRTRRRKRRRR